MTFKIETGIPLIRPTWHQSKYPFRQMGPGDSFLINGGAKHLTVGAAAHGFAKAQIPKWKFSLRKTPDGYRLWRIE